MYRLIIACIIGIILGLVLPSEISLDNVFSILLPLLLFSVGLSLRNYNFSKMFNGKIINILFPIVSLLGSICFALIYAVITNQEIKNIVLTGGAMGFYSLPAIMVTNEVGALAGMMLLITNMLREAITILLAPVIVKVFGKEALVAVGGATTMDVSLAMIKEVSGDRYVPLAIINGLVLTIGIPFLISLILYLTF